MRIAPPRPRPKVESQLLDEMLRLTQRLPPMSSHDLARIVCEHARVPVKPTAFEVRTMLRPPYFRLVARGWICLWNLPIAVNSGEDQ